MEIKQSVYFRNSDGMAVDFRFSRITTIKALTGSYKNTQLFRLFDNLREGAPFYKMSIGLVDEALQKNDANIRQQRFLKAVVVSPDYWDDIMGTVVPPLDRTLMLASYTDDFLLEGDRLAKAIALTAAQQKRTTVTETIVLNGGVGQVDLGVPFVGSTLIVAGASTTATFPATGLLEFVVGDVGKQVVVTYVTAPLHTIVCIERVAKNPAGASNIGSDPQAYVLSPALATILGIPLPSI